MQKNKTIEGLERASINEVLAVIAYALVEINDKLAALDKQTDETVTQTTAGLPDCLPEEDIPWPAETESGQAQDSEQTHTLDDIRGLLRQCTSKGVPDRGKAVLKSRGCAKVSDLKPELINTVFDELTQLLEGVA